MAVALIGGGSCGRAALPPLAQRLPVSSPQAPRRGSTRSKRHDAPWIRRPAAARPRARPAQGAARARWVLLLGRGREEEDRAPRPRPRIRDPATRSVPGAVARALARRAGREAEGHRVP